MYDELVKALRETDFSYGCPCGAEPLCKDKDCVIIQAADAIEELMRRCKPLTEIDYIELHDRYGDEVPFVVRDMIERKGERWGDEPTPKMDDVVKVVRCKDCKHKGGFGCPWWKGEDIPTDWYCANGERKDNE